MKDTILMVCHMAISYLVVLCDLGIFFVSACHQ